MNTERRLLVVMGRMMRMRKINYNAPFWRMARKVKDIAGILLGAIVITALFFMGYMLLWAMMGC